MSNLINNLLTNEKTTTTNTSSLTTDQTVKDKPSLFDSLLSNNGTTEETKVNTEAKPEIKLDDPTVVNTKEVKVDENAVGKLDTEQLLVTEEVDNKEQKITGTSSLLDRLILEAKNSVKEVIPIGNEEINKTDNSQLTTAETKINTETKAEESAVINTEIKAEEIEINTETKPEESAVINSEEVKKDENTVDKLNIDQSKVTNEVDNKGEKETSSLLDRLIK